MFKVTIDPKAILGNLDDIQTKQLPFTMKSALNQTAILAQEAERQHIRDVFRLRREDFVLKGIKIEKSDFATKTSWQVIIRVADTHGFLKRFERGEDHIPILGRWLWKPNPNVFNNKIILRSNPLHPMNLHFRSLISSHGKQVQGDQGTFMVNPLKHKAGAGPLVLQRVGKAARGVSQSLALGPRRGPSGRDANTGRFTQGQALRTIRRGGVRMLYQLVSKSKVPVRLQFEETITRVVNQNLPAQMTQAMTEALRPAK